MGWWERQVVPRLVDGTLSQSPVTDLRRTAFAGVGGRVLEIGFGSGLSLPAYPGTVTAVDAVEPSDLAWSRSAGRRAGTAYPVERVGLDGQRLAAPDTAFDAVVCAFTLCTVADPVAVLAEVRRVLRPGGALHFLEHGLSPAPGVARWQRRLDPLQQRVFGGCHLTRDPVALVEAAGLAVADVEHRHLLGGPSRPWDYLSWGRGRRS